MRAQGYFKAILTIAVALAPACTATAFAQSTDNSQPYGNSQPTADPGYPQNVQNYPPPAAAPSQNNGYGQAAQNNYPAPPPQGAYPNNGYPQQQQGAYPNNGYPQQPQGTYSNGGYPQQPGNYPPQYPQQQPNYSSGGYPHFPSNEQSSAAEVQVPPTLTVPAGKYLTVRTTNFISSNKNQPGDFFSATLAEPLVVDGFVVAARGQTVNGRVVDVQKAGRVAGVSSLRLELTEINTVDGQQLPFKSQLVYRHGDTSIGRDAAGIGTTTAVGAAIGAGVGGGFGAGMGAIGGAVVGTVGVLLTRGKPTVVYPESLLTFRVDQPITIATAHAPGAFQVVDHQDYSQPQRGFAGGTSGAYGYAPGAGAGFGGYPYGGYPYYGYGPFLNTGFYFGRPRFYYGYRGGFGYRGFRR